MRTCMKRLRSQAGETIAEVLVALLISVLGVALLVGMIGASTRVINKSTQIMQDEYSRTRVNATFSADGSVTVESGGSGIASFSVKNQTYSSGANTVYYTPKTVGSS